MNILAKTVGVIAIAIFLSFLLSYPLMLLWNGCLVPAIPAINEIGWLQAWGIGILCGMLFNTKVSEK